ncbi:putative SKIP interacting protein 12 [Paratrimastix pyriformis]|uniref:peptidylprolyl isomerase n=1 Tax=Paratrimastix pyriformis TaxID=342808 RepID=A0ABQ8U966_9EUKA|nr:putative SKIP interacting protein 12 [Paratrimastix pyriformis]
MQNTSDPVLAWVLNHREVKDVRVATKPQVRIETTLGSFVVELYTAFAPKACQNFQELCRRGRYDSTIFHRIIRDFMIQGGDPTGTGRGGQSIWGFSCRLRPAHGLTERSAAPAAQTSPYDVKHTLPSQHTIFGRVFSGMDVIQKLGSVRTDGDDRALTKVVMDCRCHECQGEVSMEDNRENNGKPPVYFECRRLANLAREAISSNTRLFDARNGRDELERCLVDSMTAIDSLIGEVTRRTAQLEAVQRRIQSMALQIGQDLAAPPPTIPPVIIAPSTPFRNPNPPSVYSPLHTPPRVMPTLSPKMLIPPSELLTTNNSTLGRPAPLPPPLPLPPAGMPSPIRNQALVAATTTARPRPSRRHATAGGCKIKEPPRNVKIPEKFVRLPPVMRNFAMQHEAIDDPKWDVVRKTIVCYQDNQRARLSESQLRRCGVCPTKQVEPVVAFWS